MTRPSTPASLTNTLVPPPKIVTATPLFIFVALLITCSTCIWVFHLRKKIRALENFRRDFIVNVSHEFRTPLSVIKGYAETLADKPVEEANHRLFLNTIREYTERMIEMVEDLLKLSRLENVHPHASSVLIHLPQFFEALRNRFQNRLEQKKISWQIDLKPPLEHLETDSDLLEMVFNNLADNAIKYTEDDGLIRIRGERTGRFITFQVEDRGIGIAPENQGRIFERFYRVSKDRRHSTGTGLGLSIVKHAVQSLGGKIWVESDIGKGSCFIFTVGSG